MAQPKTLVDIRYCEYCGWIIPRRSYDGPSGYSKRRFCSSKCSAAAHRPLYTKHTTNYWTLHWRVRQARGAAKNYACEHCGERAYDWAMLHDTDGQNSDEYIPLCRKCHVTYDDHAGKGLATRRERGTGTWTEERRQRTVASMRKRIAQRTPEERTAIAHRAWAARRQNAEEKSNASSMG